MRLCDLGRVVSRELPEGQVESFTYDAVGNMKTRTDFNNVDNNSNKGHTRNSLHPKSD